jgi:hypothetical protein
MQYLQKARDARATNEWEDLNDLAMAIATNLAREWASLTRGMRPPKPRDTECGISENLPPVAGGATPRAQTSIAPSSLTNAGLEGDFCEPECSGLLPGLHHTSCVVYLLEQENIKNELLMLGTGA